MALCTSATLGSGPSRDPAVRVYSSRRPWKAAGGSSRSLQGSAFGDMVCRATDVSLSGFHFSILHLSRRYFEDSEKGDVVRGEEIEEVQR